ANANPLTSNSLGFTLSLGTPAPALVLDYDSGFSASDGLTNSGQVNVTGLVGSTWEYQMDGGAWLAGTGKSFALTTGIHTYNVRQTYLTETATASTAVTYNYDIVGPSAPSLALASDTGTSASDNITNNPTINVVGLEAAAGTSWSYRVDGGLWVYGSGASFTALSGKHTYAVGQTDAAGNPSPISLTSTVITLDALAPTLNTTTFNFAENGTAVAAALTANSNVTDVSEPTTVTWAIASGADGSFFNIDAGTGAVTFKSAPNFEMPRGLAFNAASNSNAYTVNVTATDVAGNVKAQAIMVNVTDVNERPVLGTNTANTTAVVAQNFILNVSTAFSDPDNETNS
ncbi:MAG: Ig-like domain-containing protein, partial [Methylophilaceae bacterium]|nr:Ig-like domain-containing protein [Methylophilaceae bacterium]